MDFPPQPPKKREGVQKIKLTSFEDLGNFKDRLAGVSDGIEEPGGGAGGNERSSEKPENEPVSESAQNIVEATADEMRAKAKELYFSLAEEIRRAGVEPNDIPVVWNDAHRTYLRMIGISNSLVKVKSEEAREDLTKLFDRLAITLAESIPSRAGMEIDRFLAEHPSGPETKAEHVAAIQSAVAELSAEPETVETKEVENADVPVESDTKPDTEPKKKRLTKEARAEQVRMKRQELDEIEEQLKHTSNAALEERGIILEEELRSLTRSSGRKKIEADDSVESIESTPTELPELPAERPKFQPATKAEHLALETRGPEAMQKLRESLGEGARTNNEVAEASSPYAEKMYEAEKAYTDALKAHHRERTAGSIILEQFIGHGLPKEVQKLREEWVEARAGYAGFLKQSASERHMGKEGNAHGARRDKVLERYQRMVILREVVLGAEEAEQRAQMEGMDTRHKGWIDKAFEGYKKLPAGVRILGTAALFAGAAAAGGVLAAGPAAYLAGRAGLNWFAAEQAGTALGASAGWLARITSVGAIMGVAGELGVRAVHGALGTRRKAGETLEQRDSSGVDPSTMEELLAQQRKENEGSSDALLSDESRAIRKELIARNMMLRAKSSAQSDLTSITNLNKISKDRKKALHADETIKRHSLWGRLIGSVFGAGAGAFEHPTHEAAVSAHGHGAGAAVTSTLPFRNAFPEGSLPMTNEGTDSVQLTPEMMAHAKSLHEFGGGDAAAPEIAGHASPVHTAEVAPAHPGHHAGAAEGRAEHPAVSASTPEATHLTDDDVTLIQKWEAAHGGLPPHSDEHIAEVVARLRANNGPDAFDGVHFETPQHEIPAAPETPAEPVAAEAPTQPEPQSTEVPPASETPVQAEPAAPETATAEQIAPEQAASIPESTRPEVASVGQSEVQTDSAASTNSETPISNSDTESRQGEIPPTSENEINGFDGYSSREPFYDPTHTFLIDPKEAHAYAYHDENGSNIIAIYGGKGDDGYYAAEQYGKEHPGSVIRFEGFTKNPATGVFEPYAGSAVSDAKGNVLWDPSSQLSRPSIDRFKALLPFDFKNPK